MHYSLSLSLTLPLLASSFLSPPFLTPTSFTSLAAKVQISKYHGLGNDFILATGGKVPPLTTEQSNKLCDRNFGIGADGVIFKLDGDEVRK